MTGDLKYKKHKFDVGTVVKLTPLGETRLYEQNDTVTIPEDIGIIYENINVKAYKVHMQQLNRTLFMYEFELVPIE